MFSANGREFGSELVLQAGAEIEGFTVLETATSKTVVYRVRVTESSGERAWSSPIWVSPDLPLFADGFESGDTTQWSTTGRGAAR